LFARTYVEIINPERSTMALKILRVSECTWRVNGKLCMGLQATLDHWEDTEMWEGPLCRSHIGWHPEIRKVRAAILRDLKVGSEIDVGYHKGTPVISGGLPGIMGAPKPLWTPMLLGFMWGILTALAVLGAVFIFLTAIGVL
jgi:hypothetical protein